MRHVGTVTKSSRIANREFNAQCSCGTAGYFATTEEAISYLTRHGNKVAALGAVNTFELVDDSAKPEATPALPTPHIGGVGTMPATHATTTPPPPPAPTSAQTPKE